MGSWKARSVSVEVAGAGARETHQEGSSFQPDLGFVIVSHGNNVTRAVFCPKAALSTEGPFMAEHDDYSLPTSHTGS